MRAMFTAPVSVHVPKYISGQHLYEQANACKAKWKLWHAGVEKITMLIGAMFVNILKYISGQHLYEQADACTAKWKLWRIGLQK